MHRAKRSLPDGSTVEHAVKIVDRYMDAILEIAAFNAVPKHPHVVHLQDVVVTRANYLLVFPLAWGDVVRYQGDRKLVEEEVTRITQCVCLGLHHMHSVGIMHVDLKPLNLLVTAAPPPLPQGEGRRVLASPSSAEDDSLAQWMLAVKQDLHVCIADLGAACPGDVRMRAPKSMETVLRQGVKAVTRPYRAPEILCGMAEFTYPVDVWSVGCVVAELLEAKLLFDAKNSEGVLRQIFRMLGRPNGGTLAALPRFPGGADFPAPRVPEFPGSAKVVDFLQKCLRVDPKDRMTAREAAEHALVQPNYLQAVCDRLPAKFGEMTYVEGTLHPRLAAWLKGDSAWAGLVAAFEGGGGCNQRLQGEEGALGLKYEEAGYTRDSPPSVRENGHHESNKTNEGNAGQAFRSGFPAPQQGFCLLKCLKESGHRKVL